MNSDETILQAPKLFQVLKTDKEGQDDDEFCWNENNRSQVMDLLEATEIQLRLSDIYGGRYNYEVILYVERF
jgi:hypothetical protein